MIQTTSTATGPIFTGVAKAAARAMVVEAVRTVSESGRDDVRRDLYSGHGYRTGNYKSHVVVERRSDDRVVTDGKVVYGPWLEGVSSRNDRTRFKGYHIFRLATQRLRTKAPALVNRIVSSYIGRMQ